MSKVLILTVGTALGPPAAPGTGLRALDAFVAAHVDPAAVTLDTSPAARDALGAVARLVGTDARRADAHRAERLVVALRAAWPDVPAVQRLPQEEGKAAVLAAVVTACIVAFYDAPGARRPRRTYPGAALAALAATRTSEVPRATPGSTPHLRVVARDA